MKKFNLILLLIFCCQDIFCQCEIEIKRITVFKDATVFIEKEGNCDVDQNSILLDIPYQNGNSSKTTSYNQRNVYVKNNIILGTLEIQSPGNEILSTRSISVREDEKIHSIQQIFNQNIGKEISITLKGTKKEIKGNIYAIENTGSSIVNSNVSSVKSLILTNGNKWSFVNLNDIDDFFLEKPELTKDIERRKLLLTFEDNIQNQNIKISYLQKGITWTPNYFININDEGNLELSLKANVINDIVDLSNAEVNLAVGVPVFKYSPIVDPIFSNQRVVEFMTSLNNLGKEPKSPMRNVITTQSSSVYRESYGNNENPQLETQNQDDIFLYKLNNVYLNKYERISLDILEMKSEFENIFVANLGSNEQIVSSSRKKKSENINVWHALKFNNNTGMPLTTGTVFFKKNLINENEVMPISQGQLNFTPIGKHCIVNMSVSPDIIVHDSDVEESRVKNPKGFGYLINVEAEIEVNNFKGEKIDMMITREIKGTDLRESSEDWEVIKSTRSLYDNNQSNLIKWNFEVEPNGKKIITYKYQVFVR